MKPLSFGDAREMVLTTVSGKRTSPATETVPIDSAAGRVLARDAVADRDYPPFARAIRDGFAVRSADFPGEVALAGEVRAGARYAAAVASGQAVEIMTGAPVPDGADAVLMVEHAARTAERIASSRDVQEGEFIVPRGAECRAGATAVIAGTRLDYAHLATLATIGAATVEVFIRPRVSIVPTGDELVPVDVTPEEHQIRNSNAHSLAAQVGRAGGEPVVHPVAPDNLESTRSAIEKALDSDLLLLSGGVSAGKYDVVETVLADLDAEFFFDRVLIQPGQPLVFGRVKNTFFFGLPGNPASTMVTFELFARAALELIAGCREPVLPLSFAVLDTDFHHKRGLTRFLPASLKSGGARVEPVRWQGSGDVFALAKANAFLVAREDREHYPAGEFIEVLSR